MIKYCFDTSGISNPIETMPEDIHISLWDAFCGQLHGASVAVTKEVHDEMCHIPGTVGSVILACKAAMIFEVGDDAWDWPTYVNHAVRMQGAYKVHISEFIGGSKKTIGLNDLSIIALAKTLGKPVVSMEDFVPENAGSIKRRIPNICKAEGVPHFSFNTFLRNEKMSF
ncbi:DUF4411 family protein [Rhizobium leguminosarum bv. viciae]|uniref:DUF4411 family protein n=1 Tax=Rhizobium leguminosarum TaxID=384 RepID=UPI00103D918D|nr:DUF4411 family protein [Rhizobium leguminosarum]TCB30462.1 DUF4411 family protein [Rhizobium leguminosarum bv. viciae]